MRKASIDRKWARLGALGVFGWIAASASSACSGGGDFTSKPPEDPDASLGSGSGGASSSGGARSSGGTPSSGGAAGGSGGVAGGGTGATTSVDAGKDGGGAPPHTCVRDEDCLPFICNGSPSCMDGICGAGDPCPPAEAEACANECVRTATGASCVIMGVDQDRDGHRDARCQENPGDDCDDANALVHAGAEESCDGLDNDCDLNVDVFDGLPLGGSTEKIKDVAKSALVGLAARPGGFALLSHEMPDMFGGAGNPTELRLLGPNGGVTRTIAVRPTLIMDDSAMAVNQDGTIVLAGWNEDQFGSNAIALVRLKADGTLATPVGLQLPDAMSGSFGRAVAASAGGSTAMIYAHYANPGFGGIEAVNLNAADQLGIADQVFSQGTEPWRVYRPHLIPAQDMYAAAWVAAQPITGSSTEMTAAVHVGLISEDLKNRGDATVDSFKTPLVDLRQRGEFVRPQVALDGAGYAVAYRSGEGRLGFTLLNALLQKRCQTATIEGIASWNASSSLAKTPAGMLLVATSLEGEAVMFRIGSGTIASGAPCPFQRIGTITAPGSRIALSERFEKRQQPLCSLGDPALSLGANGKLAVTWVERDETAGELGDGGVVNDPPRPPRMMIRMLGDKLCN